ncbi:unnamed protein product [Ranitomeya imitator]|uniref:Serine dehydratase-like alpha subunit domain-containing protein n=1 Tax=Ranitomeya imitator TaxID=111125 RepID=A0ABN9LGD8_9NEOB|nr:unnamed protein product [Ranitomeya imitator]
MLTFSAVWNVMQTGIERGMTTEGVMPGKMRVSRRAAALRAYLVSSDKNSADPMAVVDWINMFALAVNEENAAGGRVVTAPTKWSMWHSSQPFLPTTNKFIRTVNTNSRDRYFLAAGAIGSLYKMNASISGAEVGMPTRGSRCSLFNGSPDRIS